MGWSGVIAIDMARTSLLFALVSSVGFAGFAADESSHNDPTTSKTSSKLTTSDLTRQGRNPKDRGTEPPSYR